MLRGWFKGQHTSIFFQFLFVVYSQKVKVLCQFSRNEIDKEQKNNKQPNKKVVNINSSIINKISFWG